jgi:hypothetical protein
MQINLKSILMATVVVATSISNLKADSFEEWSRQRREQWADDQSAWQDQWDRQALENRLEAIEAEIGN